MNAYAGRFEILGHLGEGGMGVVEEALDWVTGRIVALKRLSAERADELARAFFEREFEVLSRLRVDGVPRAHDHGSVGDEPWIAMDLVDGMPFDHWLILHRLDWREAAELLARAALVLDQVHQEGVVHGDVKPSNLLVDRGGRPWWIDFGIGSSTDARPLPEEDEAIVGTLAYLPPERLALVPRLRDPRSDVYSLGVMLYEILTGGVPFDGEDPADVMTRIEFEPPRRPDRATSGEVPRALADVVLRALEKRPERRFQSAGEFARAVLEALPIRDRLAA